MSELQIVHPGPGHWVLYDDGFNINLVAGTQRAVLLDTGFGFPGLRERAEQLCGLPVELVHTHAHGDHTGGDAAWTRLWLHPAEWSDYCQMHPDRTPELLPLEDGTVLDLGGRTLEAIHVPGHSPGSVALVDRKNRLLFSGDTVMTQPVFLLFPNSSIPDYLRSLERLSTLADDIDWVYPCHKRFPIPAREAISALRQCAQRAQRKDPDGLSHFEIDLVVKVGLFEGYTQDGYAVCTRELEPSDVSVSKDEREKSR